MWLLATAECLIHGDALAPVVVGPFDSTPALNAFLEKTGKTWRSTPTVYRPEEYLEACNDIAGGL